MTTKYILQLSLTMVNLNNTRGNQHFKRLAEHMLVILNEPRASILFNKILSPGLGICLDNRITRAINNDGKVYPPPHTKYSLQRGYEMIRQC